MNELLRLVLFLPEQRSTVARDVDYLHYFVILTTMGGAVLITLIGGYFLLRYRRRRRDPTETHPGSTARAPLLLETAALFGLAFMFLGWWNLGTRQYADLRIAPDDAMEIYVTAKQWMWKFAYPEGESMISVLYVPARRPVKLIMTSRDVIHSFFVPEFRIKQDVVPGRYTTVWFEASESGTYPILCTEYCGTSHSTMRGEVIALDPVDYERWLAGGAGGVSRPAREAAGTEGLTTPEPTTAARGERAATAHGCLRCHTLDGTPHIGPTWAGLFGSVVPLESGGEAVADAAYLTESIMDPLAKVHRGFQAVMPAYLGLISTPDVAAMVELIKSLRDVPHGPVVQQAGGLGGAGGAATEGTTR
jgi:cytochrome c oxidase subunit II